VGGAPPPPLGAAPQGAKIRKNSAQKGPDLAGLRHRGSRPDGGGGGAPARYPIRPAGEADGPPGPGRRWQQSLPPPRRAIERLGTGSREESGGE
jgi:hypothetical protein